MASEMNLKIRSVNIFFRHNLWERICDHWANRHYPEKHDRPRCDTLADPSCLVFLFEVVRATMDWFQQERDLSVGDHCMLCLYTMYSLIGHCTGYKKQAFVTKSMNNDRLTELSVRILLETDLTRRHANFFRCYLKRKSELIYHYPKSIFNKHQCSLAGPFPLANPNSTELIPTLSLVTSDFTSYKRPVRKRGSSFHQAPDTRHQAPGTRHQAPGARHQAPGTITGLIRKQAPSFVR